MTLAAAHSSEHDSPDLSASLARMGLVAPGEGFGIAPLTGGVSSDIRLVETRHRRFCLKRALPTLKVAALWEAPVSRNAAEVAWMRCVGQWLPDAVPEILGEDRAEGLFAMAYLDPAAHPVWKAELLAGRVDHAFAAAVGRALATVHARSAGSAVLAAAFDHGAVFEHIRLDPYLRATARAHPVLKDRLYALADDTASRRIALVHGDVSPKNILVGPAGPIFLDAECACYGDPAFDLAFCLNHLLLKGARAGSERGRYLASFESLAGAYFSGVAWEDPDDLERRAAALLPGLFLARIDGKSPVEYLTTEAERDAVRRCAISLLLTPVNRLGAIASAWAGPS